MASGCKTRPGAGTLRGRRARRSGFWRLGLGGLVAAVVACSGANKEGKQPESELGKTDAIGKADENAETPEEQIELGPITKGSFREHPAKVAWVFDGDPSKPKQMKIGQAEGKGYTVIDLSNTWTPYIFTEKTPGTEDETANKYRKMYIGLANDAIDSDGDKLDDWQHNYLELYGIPPSLTVIKEEWDRIESKVQPCLDAAGFDPTVFDGFDGTIAYRKGKSKKSRRSKSARWFRSKLFAAMKKEGLDPDNKDDVRAAADNPKTKKWHKRWREVQQPVDIIDHAQRRFRCEAMFRSGKGEGKFDAGHYDSPTTHALARFERKHDLMGWGHFKRDNVAMLGKTQQESVHARLLRALTERVVSSAGIVEDGSAGQWKKASFRWKDTGGKEHALRDLATEFSTAAADALGLDDASTASKQLAMLSELGEGGFKNLLVAVKMPALPEYYGENMQFETLIDRGDVWYDFPYSDEGNRKSQPRSRYPHITVYVRHNEQKIPLLHWRTTIGSWRNETKDGELMLKYKNSDVGERVWKDIVAAPVWIPPATTPAAELIKGRYKNGKFRRGVNYDEIGPGFKSAYGLVAAYHIKQFKDEDGNVTRTYDNSIRTHGSVDYMSILRRFSHGCHRLYNMDAVRLFSFILKHRDYERKGKIPVGVGRYLTVEERTYHMKIGSRGYKYQLEEPIPVTVTSGRIRGRRKSPIKEYLAKPVKEEDAEFIEQGPPVPTAPVEVPEAG